MDDVKRFRFSPLLEDDFSGFKGKEQNMAEDLVELFSLEGLENVDQMNDMGQTLKFHGAYCQAFHVRYTTEFDSVWEGVIPS